MVETVSSDMIFTVGELRSLLEGYEDRETVVVCAVVKGETEETVRMCIHTPVRDDAGSGIILDVGPIVVVETEW